MSEDTKQINTILSLDLGSILGWALCKNGKVVYSGTEDLKKKHTHPGYRFLNFHNWLCDFGNVDEVMYEMVGSFENTDSAKVYCGLLGVLQMFCLINRVRVTSLHAMTVKKEFCGTGRAEKEDICATCHSLGWKNGKLGTRLDHDEADALAVLVALMARRGVQVIL